MTVKTGEVDVRNFMIDSVEVNLQRGLVGHPTADPVLEAVTNRIVQITRQYQRAMREVTRALRHLARRRRGPLPTKGDHGLDACRPAQDQLGRPLRGVAAGDKRLHRMGPAMTEQLQLPRAIDAKASVPAFTVPSRS